MSTELVAICGAKTRSGSPCAKPPMKNGRRCEIHGGKSPRALDAAARRGLQAKLQAGVRAMGWEPVTDPAEVLADALGEMVAFKNLAREQMNELERWETQNSLGTEDVKARVAIYTQALRDVATTADKLLARGIDAAALRNERERPAREMGERIYIVMNSVLSALEMPSDQRARIPELLRFYAAQEELAE